MIRVNIHKINKYVRMAQNAITDRPTFSLPYFTYELSVAISKSLHALYVGDDERELFVFAG
mgnify:CR=1 FL=1